MVAVGESAITIHLMLTSASPIGQGEEFSGPEVDTVAGENTNRTRETQYNTCGTDCTG